MSFDLTKNSITGGRSVYHKCTLVFPLCHLNSLLLYIHSSECRIEVYLYWIGCVYSFVLQEQRLFVLHSLSLAVAQECNRFYFDLKLPKQPCKMFKHKINHYLFFILPLNPGILLKVHICPKKRGKLNKSVFLSEYFQEFGNSREVCASKIKLNLHFYFGVNHGTYIGWLLSTCCACMKQISSFWIKKRSELGLLLILSTALNRSNNGN